MSGRIGVRGPHHPGRGSDCPVGLGQKSLGWEPPQRSHVTEGTMRSCAPSPVVEISAIVVRWVWLLGTEFRGLGVG